MSERDDDTKLRGAFARLRADEARRAPTLAQLLARADGAGGERAPLRAWLRIAAPIAGAAAAALALWIAAGPRSGTAPRFADAEPQQLVRAGEQPRPPLIALGSLRSPTDVLLAPPLPALAPSFSSSLIPAPPAARATPLLPDHSRTPSARRFPA